MSYHHVSNNDKNTSMAIPWQTTTRLAANKHLQSRNTSQHSSRLDPLWHLQGSSLARVGGKVEYMHTTHPSELHGTSLL